MLSAIFTSPLTIAVILLAVIVIVLAFAVVLLNIKLKKFLVGKNAEHLGDSLDNMASHMKDMEDFRHNLETHLKDVENRVKRSIQSVQTIRFNPFQGTGSGGNQSFATAFLDENGDGVVISSLYSRDHVSVFSKPVKKNSSEHELSTEERRALDQASQKLK